MKASFQHNSKKETTKQKWCFSIEILVYKRVIVDSDSQLLHPITRQMLFPNTSGACVPLIIYACILSPKKFGDSFSKSITTISNVIEKHDKNMCLTGVVL